MNYYFEDRPFLLPFVGIVLVISLMGFFIVRDASDVVSTEVTGTVCCLSERVIVLSAKRNIATKMMYVDLSDNHRVEVPIIDIPYLAGRKIVLDKSSKPDKLGLRYKAVRYI